MRNEAWYQEKIGGKSPAGSAALSVVEGSWETTDLLADMRKAYNEQKYADVITYYNKAVSGSLAHAEGIYLHARNALRHLLDDGDAASRAAWARQLDRVYESRLANIGTEEYSPQDNNQWNEWQWAVDYARYTEGNTPDGERYSRLADIVARKDAQPEYHAVVKMLEISFAQNKSRQLSNDQLYDRYKSHIAQLDKAQDWLSTMPSTRGDIVRIENAKEQFGRAVAPTLSYDKFVAEYADEIRAHKNDQRYLTRIFNMMSGFDGRPLYAEVEGYLDQWADYASYRRKGDDAYRSKKFADAVGFYTKALDLADIDERRAEAEGLIGSAYFAQRKYVDAATHTQKAIATVKDNPLYYKTLAQCCVHGYPSCTNESGDYLLVAACWAAQDILREGLAQCDRASSGYNDAHKYIDELQRIINTNKEGYNHALFLGGKTGKTVTFGGFIHRSVVLKRID